MLDVTSGIHTNYIITSIFGSNPYYGCCMLYICISVWVCHSLGAVCSYVEERTFRIGLLFFDDQCFEFWGYKMMNVAGTNQFYLWLLIAVHFCRCSEITKKFMEDISFGQLFCHSQLEYISHTISWDNIFNTHRQWNELEKKMYAFYIDL